MRSFALALVALIRRPLSETARRTALGAIAALGLAAFLVIAGAPAGEAAPVLAAEPLGDAKGVEQPALRTRTSRTYLDDTGAYQAVISPGSVNYRDAAGEWQPIDTKLVPSDDGFGIAANSYGLDLPARAGDPVRVSLGDSWVSLALVGAASPVSVSGNAARYAEVRPGTDLTYEATPDTVKETITLRDRTAAAVQTYRLATSADLSVSLNRGALRFVDRAGAERFSIAAPFLEDAAGARSDDVAVSLTRDAEGSLLTITPDRAWLASADRKYPVIIDPTISPGATTDCSLISGSSASTTYCADPLLKIGYDGSKTHRSILKFDVSSIPAQTTVMGAWVALNTTGSTTGATINTSLHNLTRAFTSSATWNTYNGSSAWTTAGGDYTATAEYSALVAGNTGYKYWYLTQLAQNWVDGTTTNHGVIIRPTTTTNQVISFASAQHATSSIRPFLSVTYQPWLGVRDIHSFEQHRLSDRAALAVNVANGNLMADYADLDIAGTGLPLQIGHHFNSRSPYFGAPHGNKWIVDNSDQVKLYLLGDTKVYQGPGGYRVPFIPNGSGGYITPSGVNATLVKNGDNTYTMTFDRTGIRFQYSSSGVLTRIEDRNGNDITMAYSSGRTSAVTDTQGRAVSFAYNGSGYLSTLTDSTGRQQTFSYDANLHLRTITDAAGKQTLMEYTDPSNSLTKVTDPLGNVTRMTYDASGRVLTITRVTNTLLGTGPVTTYAYSASTTGCPSGTVGATTSTNPNSHTTRYCYDRLGRVTRTFDPLGNATSTTFTPNSDPDVATTPAGLVTDNDYNGDNEPIAVTEPDGVTATTSYGDATHPDLPTTATVAGTSTSYVYTSQGNICSVSADAVPPATCTGIGTQQTTMAYNGDGTISSVEDAAGRITNYTYDAVGNLTAVDQPSPRGDESMSWDGLSRLATYTDGKGQTSTMTYDVMDRLVSVAHTGGPTLSYTYDAAGRLATETDQSGTTTYTYSALGQLTSEAPPGGLTNTYAYDPAGNLLTFTDPGGAVSYSYDAANRLSSLTEPLGALTTFGYDADGRPTTTILPASTGVSIARTWVDGQLTRVRATKGASDLIDYRYCYRNPATGCATTPQSGSPSPLMTSVDDAVEGNITTYGYDALSRMTDATTVGANPRTEVIVYDAAGNRASWTVDGAGTAYAYNGANQLTQAGATTFSYDPNGSVTGSSSGLALTYNVLGQTANIATAATGAVSQSYRGSGQSRRATAGTTTFGDSKLGLSFTNTGAATTFYTRRPNGELLGQRGPSGASYYLFDGSGSLAAVVDASGSIVGRYAYDAYGGVIRSSGTSDAPWRFGGAFLDQSGLYKIGAGYYDPATGRETQPGGGSYSYGPDGSGSPAMARLTRSQILDRIVVARDVPLSYFIGVLRGSVRFSDRTWAQMDWSSDGCSVPGVVGHAHSWYVLFNQPCVRHDFGYRNSAIGAFRGATHKASLDNRFVGDMNSVCRQVYGFTAAANRCLSVASQWWVGVRTFGSY